MSLQEHLTGKYRIMVLVTHEINNQHSIPKILYMDGISEEEAKQKAKVHFTKLGYVVNRTHYLPSVDKL